MDKYERSTVSRVNVRYEALYFANEVQIKSEAISKNLPEELGSYILDLAKRLKQFVITSGVVPNVFMVSTKYSQKLRECMMFLMIDFKYPDLTVFGEKIVYCETAGDGVWAYMPDQEIVEGICTEIWL